METVMCTSYGAFVPAIEADGGWMPLPDECPACGGTKFKDTKADTVRTGDS